MSQRATVLFTYGAPGSGKSYVRCARFMLNFLVDSRSRKLKTGEITVPGKHISNFPVDVDVMSRTVAKRNKSDVKDELSRIEVIPNDEIIRWRNEESGPWEYFADRSASENGLFGCHIALDEAHEYISPDVSKEYAKLWDEWIGQIRHQSCTIEFLTQSKNSLHKVITARVSQWVHLVNLETHLDPWFKIEMGDWYELQAAYTKEYNAGVVEEFYVIGGAGKQAKVKQHKWRIDPRYFSLYDSYSASADNQKRYEEEAGEGEKLVYKKKLNVYQTHSFLRVHWWFFKRNKFQLFSRFVFISILIFMTIGGGSAKLVNFLSDSIHSVAKANGVEQPKTATTQNQRQLTPEEQKIQNCKKLLDEQKEQNKQLQEQLDTLKLAVEEKSKRESAIVMMNANYIILESGERLYANETVERGFFKGAKIKEIDTIKRCVRFYDGTLIWL